MTRFELGDVPVDLRVDESLLPSVMRMLAGRTVRDAAVDDLPLPDSPRWRVAAIRCLREYRRRRPASIGQRCVFDPSCSRYAELVLRQQHPLQGTLAILGRLLRCRPGRGGVDLP